MSIGRIAAADSFPDVYAMGGRPLRYSVKTNCLSGFPVRETRLFSNSGRQGEIP